MYEKAISSVFRNSLVCLLKNPYREWIELQVALKQIIQPRELTQHQSALVKLFVKLLDKHVFCGLKTDSIP